MKKRCKEIIGLTKAEEEVMQILWQMENGFIKDLMPYFDDPKPAYNTVSTIVRILEKKGYVAHKAYGKSYLYYPLISKDSYRKSFFKGFLKNYFGDSFKHLVSFFSKQDEFSIAELEEMKKIVEEELKNKKENE